jgi:indolepyruvate ferredoxin oxidoreductase beta subunit
MKANILIVGVGGQGTLLASRILGALADLCGDDCKLSEVHGMSQRGGSVVTNVKIAKKVTSPIIGYKDADIILAFEKLEALRYINYLKDGGAVVVNNQEILPMPVIIGARKYPEGIEDELKAKSARFAEIDALSIAEELGNVKTVNVIMIGALAKRLDIPFAQISEALKRAVKPAFFDINLKALERGFKI